jgi:hypothetical protein
MLGTTPAQLVFPHGMIIYIKTVIDWRTITAPKQKQVIKDTLRENKDRISYLLSMGKMIHGQWRKMMM